MNQSDLMFLVMFVILLSMLTVFVVQFVRSRRGKGDRSGNWWEGPWDDDRKG